MDRIVRYSTFEELDNGEISSELDSKAKKTQAPYSHCREALKYGDWFYFRSPETRKLISVHPTKVHAALIDEQKNEVIGWIVKDLEHKTEPLTSLDESLSRRNLTIVPAKDMVQLTCDGVHVAVGPGEHYNEQTRWPFGFSCLETYITHENSPIFRSAP